MFVRCERVAGKRLMLTYPEVCVLLRRPLRVALQDPTPMFLSRKSIRPRPLGFLLTPFIRSEGEQEVIHRALVQGLHVVSYCFVCHTVFTVRNRGDLLSRHTEPDSRFDECRDRTLFLQLLHIPPIRNPDKHFQKERCVLLLDTDAGVERTLCVLYRRGSYARGPLQKFVNPPVQRRLIRLCHGHARQNRTAIQDGFVARQLIRGTERLDLGRRVDTQRRLVGERTTFGRGQEPDVVRYKNLRGRVSWTFSNASATQQHTENRTGKDSS